MTNGLKHGVCPNDGLEGRVEMEEATLMDMNINKDVAHNIKNFNKITNRNEEEE